MKRVLHICLLSSIHFKKANLSNLSSSKVSSISAGCIFPTCWKLKSVWIFLFRSVPLNIIISVDNYILQNGTEQGLESKDKCRTFFYLKQLTENYLYKRIDL